MHLICSLYIKAFIYWLEATGDNSFMLMYKCVSKYLEEIDKFEKDEGEGGKGRHRVLLGSLESTHNFTVALTTYSFTFSLPPLSVSLPVSVYLSYCLF